MVSILTLLMVISVSVGVFFASVERDYGISLMGWTLAAGFSALLHFGIEPNVADTYVIHHDFFRKVTLATGTVAFVAMLLLSFMVTVNTNRDRKELRRLREDQKILLEALETLKNASRKKHPPITIDLERNRD